MNGRPPDTDTRPAGSRALTVLSQPAMSTLWRAVTAAVVVGVLATDRPPLSAIDQGREPDPAAASVNRALTDPGFRRVQSILDRDFDRVVNDTVRLTEIPAPPFREDARALAYLALLKDTGLTNVERDAAGNVLGLWPGTTNGPLIAIAAHLDTVFPEGTDVHVTRAGTKLAAPGIGDDTKSLAELLALARALREAQIHTATGVLFVADVGEEGS